MPGKQCARNGHRDQLENWGLEKFPFCHRAHDDRSGTEAQVFWSPCVIVPLFWHTITLITKKCSFGFGAGGMQINFSIKSFKILTLKNYTLRLKKKWVNSFC